jgi:hypothetical protein
MSEEYSTPRWRCEGLPAKSIRLEVVRGVE